jgi:hypothetical protein
MTHTWNLQEENDIDNFTIGWESVDFACIMRDGTLRKFSAFLAECYDGSINKHIECFENDEYTTDDILYWIDMPSYNKSE